jgi:RimJ/RimL family protein N-acetyltransferase
MTPAVPVLETERLILRGHCAEDIEDSVALWSDPLVTRYIGGKTFGREEVWARIPRYVGHWAVAGYGFWHVRERATGRFVGETGIADFKRELAIPFDGACEAGWVLAPWSHGKGYATEAMTAVLGWAASRAARTVCLIDPGNVASLRVAAKLGYRQLARTTYKHADVIVLDRAG